MLLELERVYNHVADVGALCNDVGFGLAQAKALTLRERLLRLNATVTGHRLLRGGVDLAGARVGVAPRPEPTWPRSASSSMSWWTWPSARASSWTASPAQPCSAETTSTRSVFLE